MVHPTLLVMAAGAGSRFGGPKQMTGVGPHGEWLMEYAVHDAIRAGFRRVVFVIRREHAAQFTALVERLAPHIDARVAVQHAPVSGERSSAAERDKPWGTGHAVLSARGLISDAFAVVNADDFYGADAYVQAAGACGRASETGRAAVIVMRLDATLSAHGPVTRAICRVEGGRVLEMQEVAGIARHDGALISDATGRALGGSKLVSMNFWIFPDAIFRLLSARFDVFHRQHHADPDEEFRLPDVVNDLVRKDALELDAIEAGGPWFGLTHAEDLDDVRAALAELGRRGEYATPLWTMVPPV